jgi:hypothetical protein
MFSRIESAAIPAAAPEVMRTVSFVRVNSNGSFFCVKELLLDKKRITKRYAVQREYFIKI